MRASSLQRGGIRSVAHGFTLMEMLVTLVLIAFATMLMFQMLGSYRVARERVQAQAGLIDRQTLFQAWFRDSVHGLYAAPNLHMEGSAEQFSGTTLNPLYALEGTPTTFAWQLHKAADGGTEVAYVEANQERWRLRLQGASGAHFIYVDAASKQTDRWPPQFGLINPEGLPALVGLVRDGADDGVSQLAAVLGPLEPPKRLYGNEQTME
ncbi:MAG TPA: type II secretion system protein [Thermomonas sp.]|uniref:PulJ/GspJ family protein n=1 Tax=Thermomonas sp. TaxID=1971895 RepID=UPI002C0300E8|nr:type II secretion system protein [Thermomonas sp.]HOV97032.1 type II secretion system protein [Thermomonas sp.]